MSKQLNATCVLCGKKYHRCDTCEKMKNTFASWRILTDSIEHFKLFDLLRDYGLGKVKKNDLLKELKNFDLSDVDTWLDESNKRLVKDLLKENEKESKDTKEKIVRKIEKTVNKNEVE